MTVPPDVVPATAARDILRRYFFALGAPFAIDVATVAVYAWVNGVFDVLGPMVLLSAAFLLVGVWTGGWFLIRPVRRFLAADISFAETEHAIAELPRRSAILIGCLYAPMLLMRLLSARYGVTFGANVETAESTDAVCSFLVSTSFNVVLTFFVVSAYLDRLCEFLFSHYGVNIATFPGAFRRKIGLAVLFVSFAAMILLAGDIASYSGERLIREATMDVSASVVGAATIYYWISRALTHPIHRLDVGMKRVAENDLATRLPVTSDDEIGHATSEFNRMAAGLEERAYLRDTFGKYVSESVAAEILDTHHSSGRVADATGVATLMFTDIEGFTGLSERVSPTDLASLLNTYLSTVVPEIERHGGVVNKFIGDGLFASFNMPLPLEDHAAAAIRAAVDIERALAATEFPGGVKVRTRIGLNTGPVIGLSIGTDKRLDYTLLGDAVNVASRVEQLNKQFGSLILATESTIRAAGSEHGERLGSTGVRGHEGEIVVYRIDAQA
ncbi:MAG: adenylate/guanylate cyclase domain-containing protein [Proteobacteria bacterium]|nr:adenylate/guanylate cyclase domain-containing protein [Pseudomonadota bacterium]